MGPELSACILEKSATGLVLSPQVHWNRAARTDKGVSAAGNVVSLKMMIGFPDIVERINAALPPQVLASFCVLSVACAPSAVHQCCCWDA